MVEKKKTTSKIKNNSRYQYIRKKMEIKQFCLIKILKINDNDNKKKLF